MTAARRLAAIPAADVVGYARDERGRGRDSADAHWDIAVGAIPYKTQALLRLGLQSLET